MPTIGVALSIPEPWGRQLQEYRSSLGDLSADGIPTHITLLGPVAVGESDLPRIEEHLVAAAASVEPFRLVLRGTDTFRPVSPVVFVNVVEGCDGCVSLAEAVLQGPLAVEPAFPYHPHVTIAHDLADDVLDLAFSEQAGFEAGFDALGFHLYVHDPATGWEPVRDFHLGSASQ